MYPPMNWPRAAPGTARNPTGYFNYEEGVERGQPKMTKISTLCMGI